MKKTQMITAAIVMLAITVFAGEAIGQPGGRGGRQGLGRGMAGGPRMGANFQPVQPDNSWVPGPYCPFGQGPNQNIRGRQGPGPGGIGQGWQGRGPGGFGQGIQGRGAAIRGRGGRGFQGRGMAIQGRGGRGFQGRGMAIQGRGGRDFQGRGPGIRGRGGRDFQGRNPMPQGWRMNGRQGQFRPEGMGRPGPGMQQRWFAPEDTDRTNQPAQPRGRGWVPGYGPGTRQGRGPGWQQDWTPDWGTNPQPEKAPDANVPKPPIVENQPEKPQDE